MPSGDDHTFPEATDRGLSRLLFLVIVLIELVHSGTAAFQHRVPTGHDGFQYFTLQYYFLNNAIQAHEVAQWIPYMTQGTVATFWYGIQGSFLQNVLLYTASLLRSVDLLFVYHLGIFIDEMILLTGTWLLARRFFPTSAVFFIAVSVVGSCVWLDQPYWNFRLYYAIPLVLELGHRFLDTGRWRWCFLALNLLALQSVGNLPYFIPLASFVVFAYFAWYAAANHRFVWKRLRSLRWRWAAASALILGATSFLVAYKCLTIGTDQLVSYNVGRGPDGTTDLNGFLTYGGVTDLHKWIDLVLNLSPWLDLTLYAGILLMPLLLCGLLVADRRRIHLVLFAVTMLSFTLGTIVSVALYYAWPGMTYFRHIGLVSPLVKVFFCFVAGIGFEWLFERHPSRSKWAVRAAATMAALLLMIGAWQALRISRSGPAIGAYVDALSVAAVDRPLHTYHQDILARRLRQSAALALEGAAVIGVVPFVLGLPLFTRSSRARGVMVCVVLAFVATDLYRFKFAYLFDRSDVIPSGVQFVTHPSTMPYARHRELDLPHAAMTSTRLQATLGFSEMMLLHFQDRPTLGAQYWSNNAFWFTDEAGSSLQADSWLKPLDQLIRMFRGEPINDTSTVPQGYEGGRLQFPVERVAAAAVSGVSADKIRFFAHAYSVVSADDLVPLMTDDSYNGDLLFVLPAPDARGSARSVPWTSQQPLSTDDSRPLPYQVQQFDADNLIVKVSNPESGAAWMSYSDMWHPSWHATVNDRPVPVYRANMAYKAVPIEPGDNVIHFHFGSALFSILSAIVSANSAFWLCATAWMIWGLLRAPSSDSGLL